ncbi:MAG: DUF2752 domain-containing protein [Lachnospiraceae bacterium]|nr:DUF2752 domain-containing protein [Lachnospiraceae bacterium]
MSMISENNISSTNREYKNGYSGRKLSFLLLILLAGIAYLIWIRAGGISVPCFFHEATGLDCPGCGITRMIRAICEADFKAALHANAFLFITLPYLLFLLLYYAYKWARNEKTGAKFEAAAIVYCVGLVIFGIVRNLI